MRAATQSRYGPPEVLDLEEVAEPTPGEGEALVRVEAAGVSISDWHLMRGIPYMVRLFAGLSRPKQRIIGADLAGVVEALGPGAEGPEPGTEVFGWAPGAFAEYACAPVDQLLPKPAALDFEQAAAVGDSAVTALIAVRDKARVGPGQRVLINGASGGVGTFAIQLSRALGAEVAAVCGAASAETVRSLGAEDVIDYEREDFTEREGRYDAILDLIGNRSLRACRRALAPDGVYVLVGVRDLGRFLGMGRQIRALASAPFVRGRTSVFVAERNRPDLLELAESAEAGSLVPLIAARYRLAEVDEALRRQGGGHARGKIVITMAGHGGEELRKERRDSRPDRRPD